MKRLFKLELFQIVNAKSLQHNPEFTSISRSSPLKKLFLIFALLALAGLKPDSLGAQGGTIQEVIMEKCGNDRVLYQGETFDVCYATGFGITTATNVAVSGSGVSAQITESTPLVKQVPPTGRIRIKFTADRNAATGNRTVTVSGGTFGSGTFTIRIKPPARIPGPTLKTIDGTFKDNVVVALSGENDISKIKGLSAIIVDEGFNHPLDENGNQTSNIIVTDEILTNTSASATVRLNFSKTLSQASVRLRIWGDPNVACSGLRPYKENELIHIVDLKGNSVTENYVQDQIFDRNDRTYKVGDVVTVTIKLAKPVPSLLELSGNVATQPISSSTPAYQQAGTTSTNAARKVFWALLPSDSFEQAGPSGTAYDPNAHHNEITFTQGAQTKTITFVVKKCAGGGNNASVKLVTWKPDPFNDATPNRKETAFTINCQ